MRKQISSIFVFALISIVLTGCETNEERIARYQVRTGPPQDPAPSYRDRKPAARRTKYGPSQGAQFRPGRFSARNYAKNMRSKTEKLPSQNAAESTEVAIRHSSSPAPNRDSSDESEASDGSSALAMNSTPSFYQFPSAPKSEPKTFSPNELPFADPIPGKSGYVTLPKGNPFRGEIDVRGISSGTPVEIPDPDSPGETVQFRVP